MRILHICESYPPQYGGGAGVYTADICRELVLRGHDVRVLSVEPAGGSDYSVRSDVQAGVTVRRVTLGVFATRDPEGWGLGLMGYQAHEARVDALIRSEVGAWPPDVVHLHTTRPFGEQPFFTLPSLGVPMVAMAHEAWLICMRLMLLRSPSSAPCKGPTPVGCTTCLYTHYDPPWAIAKLPWRLVRQGMLPLYRLRRRQSARLLPAVVIAYSRFMAEILGRHIPDVRYIPLGVAHPPSMPPRHTRPRAPFRFGFFAGAQPAKGLPDVLAAMRVVRLKGIAAELHIWGNDGDRVMELIAASGSSEFARFRGSYGADSMWSAYTQVDAAVMATRMTEAYGRIPQEAALSGIPSIVPAVGGLTEQIRDGIDGLLFRFQDASSLARQMERLAREPSLYTTLASNLWPVRNTVDAVADIEAVYGEVLRVPGKARPQPRVAANGDSL